jgi:hypothetical protein
MKYWEYILVSMVPSCDVDGLNGQKRMGPVDI